MVLSSCLPRHCPCHLHAVGSCRFAHGVLSTSLFPKTGNRLGHQAGQFHWQEISLGSCSLFPAPSSVFAELIGAQVQDGQCQPQHAFAGTGLTARGALAAHCLFSGVFPRMQNWCCQHGAGAPEDAEQGHGGPRAATAPWAHLRTEPAPGALLVQNQPF